MILSFSLLSGEERTGARRARLSSRLFLFFITFNSSTTNYNFRQSLRKRILKKTPTFFRLVRIPQFFFFLRPKCFRFSQYPPSPLIFPLSSSKKPIFLLAKPNSKKYRFFSFAQLSDSYLFGIFLFRPEFFRPERQTIICPKKNLSSGIQKILSTKSLSTGKKHGFKSQLLFRHPSEHILERSHNDIENRNAGRAGIENQLFRLCFVSPFVPRRDGIGIGG